MITAKRSELENLVKEIKCPLNKLSVENGEAFCNQPVQIGGLEIEKSCLGQVAGEIKSTCAGCKLKMLAETTIAIKIIPVEDGCVKCPALNTETDLETTCMSCPFFAKEKFLAMASEDGNGEKITRIPCNYPNFPKEKLKLFINKKKAAGVK